MKSYRFQLSMMMFLEFFIWGAWLPLIFGYLPSMGFNAEWQQPLILGAFNLAAFTAMFFSTQFADRHFAAEKFLSFSMVVAGAAILGLAFLQPGTIPVDPLKPDGPKLDAPFWPFFGLMLLHSLFYVPTISITNSIAFANVKDPQREFGPVRLWGTIGWIAASWPFVFLLVDWQKVPEIGTIVDAKNVPVLNAKPEVVDGKEVFVNAEGKPIENGKRVGTIDWLGIALGTSKTGPALMHATSYTFIAAGVACFLLAGFSLILPHTPPKPVQEGAERFAWLEAMKLLRVPFLLVLFIVTFFDAAVHQCYFFWSGRYLEHGVGIPGNWVMPVMSVGQIAEIGTMAFLGYALKSMGWRTTMVVGILGHAARFAVFAFFPIAVVAISVNVLHGICYAFFFATVYIFVDEFFPKGARSSAQGLFNFLILGLGPFLGNFLWAYLGVRYELPPLQPGGKPRVDFHHLFIVPAAIALVAALALVLFFRPPDKAPAGPEKLVDEGDFDKFKLGPVEGITASPTSPSEQITSDPKG